MFDKMQLPSPTWMQFYCRCCHRRRALLLVTTESKIDCHLLCAYFAAFFSLSLFFQKTFSKCTKDHKSQGSIKILLFTNPTQCDCKRFIVVILTVLLQPLLCLHLTLLLLLFFCCLLFTLLVVCLHCFFFTLLCSSVLFVADVFVARYSLSPAMYSKE